jgi:putative ABC transport system permease protein
LPIDDFANFAVLCVFALCINRQSPIGNFLEVTMNTLIQDVRYGIRVLLTKRGFSAIAVLTLAMGIAATTSIFSVVDAVLLRPFPIKDPARIVVIHNQLPKLNLPRTPVSAPQYVDYTRDSDAFEATAALGSRNFNLTGFNEPERLQASRVTASFFPMLGVSPTSGRFFSDEEDRFGNQHVIVLSSRLWKRLFNSDSSPLEKTIQLDGESYQIVGIAPADLEQLYPRSDMWMPMAFSPTELSEQRRGSLSYTMLARLKPGIDIGQAQSVMGNIARGIAGDHPDEFGIEVRSLIEERVEDVRKPLFILLCAVVIVLLISCANVASLLLARASSRTHEIAIRSALGASRGRLIRQLLTESIVLAIVGEALGVFLAWWGTGALIELAPANLPRLSEVRLNPGVLLFSLAVSLVCGIIFGLMPAITSSRTNLANSLKESGRTDSGNPARHRLLGGLTVAEVALAFVLLISAGLLLRSFTKLLDVRPGFDPHNVLTMQIALPRTRYTDFKQVAAFHDAVLQGVSSLPGVQHAAFGYQPPFTPGGDNSIFLIRDRHADPNDPAPHADYGYVTSDYFRATGIPLVAGRDFEASDMRTFDNMFAPGAVAIVDEELAKRFWPNGDALGGGISWSPKGPWATIVGIVATAQLRDLTEASKGTFYLPVYPLSGTLVVRATNEPQSLTRAVREQVLAADKNQPVYDIQTMDERVARSLDQRRFAMALLGVFSAFALLLAGIGLYGVLAFAVSQRTREIGIRMALGAQATDVLRQVMRQGMMLVSIGVVLGLAAAFALTRLMSSLLYGISSTDALTFIAISVLLIGVALVACFVPARRATKVDPMVALRYE